ncbi:MAG: hypothetical protein KBT06_01280 [Prevotellaceae bacterium]|nr:hypothetical protein [Candidatus Colivivens equi]
MLNLQRKTLCKHLLVGGALLVAVCIYSCKDGYDLDEKQPSGLNSIYGYLSDQGKFTKMLQLIDELGQAETLSKTGSKTLFAADDDAFARFFQDNKWGVHSYGELTLTQKKLLLYSAMIDNPYPTSMLSSAQGPVKGEVCRRSSSQSVFDSVQVIYPQDYAKYLPDNPYFTPLLRRDSIVLFKDGSGAAPMVHFNAQFVTGNRLESSDIDFLYGQPAGTRLSDDVYVNHSKVINDPEHMNVFCKNGFVHVVDNVITPLDNMAEIINTDKDLSIYSSILERFAVPMDSASLTTAYNNVKGLSLNNEVNTQSHAVDTVFLKRYFSERSLGSTDTQKSALSMDRFKNPSEALLKFDPGWNTYVADIPSDRVPLMEDMGVMLAPTNAAIQQWWNESGKVIQDYYASGITDAAVGLAKVPMSVLDDLLNVNMLNSLTGSLPSRFKDVLNDAQEPLGLTLDKVDKVTLGCNGAVYSTNVVYPPTTYSSVLFPAVVDTADFSIIRTAIELLEYDKYLNSMVSTYSFFLPTNNGLLTYVDPVSYGQTKEGKPAYQMWEFGLDPKVTKSRQITANIYDCILNPDGTWEKGALVTQLKNVETSYAATSGQVSVLADRMLDILDNIIVSEPLVKDKSFYKTKGNNFIKVTGTVDQEGEMYAWGSWQTDRNQPIKIGKIFPMRNGKSYILSDAVTGPDNRPIYSNSNVIMNTPKSVSQNLVDMSECSDFFEMLQNCGAITKVNTKDKWVAGDQQYGNLLAAYKTDAGKDACTYLLNAYHYTIYAPTNEAMKLAYADGLPTMEDLALAELYDEMMGDLKENTDSAEHVKSVMLDFIKYHIQDNSIFVDEGFEAGNYESGKTELTPALDDDGNIAYDKNGEMQYSPGRPYKINVTPSASGIELVDAMGRKINVVTSNEKLYNVYSREYWYNGSEVKKPYDATINNSSCAVIHAVDKPLYFNFTEGSADPDQNQFIYKKRKVTNDSGIKNRSPRKVVR